MVTHHFGHILGSNLAGRLHEEGHLSGKVVPESILRPVGCWPRYFDAVLFIYEYSVAEDVECAPCAGIAGARTPEIKRIVCFAEREFRIFSGKPSLLAGEGDDVRRIKAVLGIVQGKSGDPGLVGVCADISVRNPAGHPHYALVIRSLANEVHHPCLVLVGNREGLAFRRIAVAVRKGYYRVDGGTCGRGSLKRDVNQ